MRTDAELVSAVLDGDKQIFAELVKRYERPVRAVALDVLNDYHLAADVSQETFVKAYENLRALRRPVAFGSWLMKIARRNALELARRKTNENQLEIKIAGATENTNGQLDEDKQRLLAVIAKLPKAEQQVVMLRLIEGFEFTEIASLLKKREGNIRVILHRALVKLRSILEKEGGQS